MDLIPFARMIGGILCFGLSFYFLALMVTGLTDALTFNGVYAEVLISLWLLLPAVVLLFSGIRLVMVQQKRKVV